MTASSSSGDDRDASRRSSAGRGTPRAGASRRGGRGRRSTPAAVPAVPSLDVGPPVGRGPRKRTFIAL